MPRKSEGGRDMYLPSLAKIGVTGRCHSIIPMCQCACRGNCKLDACQGGSRDGLQTFNKFASTWFANYDMFASGSTRITRLTNTWYVFEHAVGKDIMSLWATQNNTLFILRNRPPPLCLNWQPYDSIWLIFRGFVQSAANKHYFTMSGWMVTTTIIRSYIFCFILASCTLYHPHIRLACHLSNCSHHHCLPAIAIALAFTSASAVASAVFALVTIAPAIASCLHHHIHLCLCCLCRRCIYHSLQICNCIHLHIVSAIFAIAAPAIASAVAAAVALSTGLSSEVQSKMIIMGHQISS